MSWLCYDICNQTPLALYDVNVCVFIALRRRRLGGWGLWLKVLLSGRYKEVLGFGFGNWGQGKGFGFRISPQKDSIQHTLLTTENNRWVSESYITPCTRPFPAPLPHICRLSLRRPLSLPCIGNAKHTCNFRWTQWYFYGVNYMWSPHAFMGIPCERVTCRYII